MEVENACLVYNHLCFMMKAWKCNLLQGKKLSSTLTSNCCICQQYHNTNQWNKQKKDDKKKEHYPWGRTSMRHSTRGQLSDLSSVDWITPPEVALEIQETDFLLDQTLDRNLRAFFLTSPAAQVQPAKPSCTRILLSQFTENPPNT